MINTVPKRFDLIDKHSSKNAENLHWAATNICCVTPWIVSSGHKPFVARAVHELGRLLTTSHKRWLPPRLEDCLGGKLRDPVCLLASKLIQVGQTCPLPDPSQQPLYQGDPWSPSTTNPPGHQLRCASSAWCAEGTTAWGDGLPSTGAQGNAAWADTCYKQRKSSCADHMNRAGRTNVATEWKHTEITCM